MAHQDLQIHAAADAATLCRPCVDCGRKTGNYCETMLQKGHVAPQGGVCLATAWIPSENGRPGSAPLFAHGVRRSTEPADSAEEFMDVLLPSGAKATTVGAPTSSLGIWISSTDGPGALQLPSIEADAQTVNGGLISLGTASNKRQPVHQGALR